MTRKGRTVAVGVRVTVEVDREVTVTVGTTVVGVRVGVLHTTVTVGGIAGMGESSPWTSIPNESAKIESEVTTSQNLFSKWLLLIASILSLFTYPYLKAGCGANLEVFSVAVKLCDKL